MTSDSYLAYVYNFSTPANVMNSVLCRFYLQQGFLVINDEMTRLRILSDPSTLHSMWTHHPKNDSGVLLCLISCLRGAAPCFRPCAVLPVASSDQAILPRSTSRKAGSYPSYFRRNPDL